MPIFARRRRRWQNTKRRKTNIRNETISKIWAHICFTAFLFDWNLFYFLFCTVDSSFLFTSVRLTHICARICTRALRFQSFSGHKISVCLTASTCKWNKKIPWTYWKFTWQEGKKKSDERKFIYSHIQRNVALMWVHSHTPKPKQIYCIQNYLLREKNVLVLS